MIENNATIEKLERDKILRGLYISHQIEATIGWGKTRHFEDYVLHIVVHTYTFSFDTTQNFFCMFLLYITGIYNIVNFS